jgi:DNA repair protein RadB
MLTTGCPDLDKHFTYSNSINCIYGKGATGKTNLCLLLASKLGKNKKIAFIDTENGFSPERIDQLNNKNSLNNILVIQVNNFNEQHKAILNLLKMKDLINIVIIDSLSMHYRKELQEKNPETNNLLSKQFNILSELTNNNIPVIITCQVYSKLDNTIEPIGSNMIRNWSKCIIKLEQNDKRTLTLEKHPELGPKTINFTIKNNGIFIENFK